MADEKEVKKLSDEEMAEASKAALVKIREDAFKEVQRKLLKIDVAALEKAFKDAKDESYEIGEAVKSGLLAVEQINRHMVFINKVFMNRHEEKFKPKQ